MSFRLISSLFVLLFCFVLSSLNSQSSIDSLSQLALQDANDSLKGMRYLELAQAWFWEDPTPTDSLLTKATDYLRSAKHYSGLSDVHNFRANYHYMGGRPAQACVSLDSAMHYAALDGDSLHIIGIRKNLTILREESGDLIGALTATEESISYLLKHKDSSLLAEHYLQRGLIRKRQGFRQLALDDFQLSRELHLAKAEIARVADAESGIAKILNQEGKYLEARKYLIASAQHYQKSDRQQYYAEILTLLGDNYHRTGDYTQADSLFEQAIQLSTKLQQPYNTAHARLLQAESWLERGIRLDEASVITKKSLPDFETIMPIMVGSGHFLLARINIATNDFRAAQTEIEKAIEVFTEYSDATNLVQAQRLQAQVLSTLGKPADALVTYRKAQVLNDSLFNLKNSQAVAELHLRYESELKDRELALKAATIKRIEGEKQNAKLKSRLLAVGLLATLTLLLLSFYVYQLRRKALEAEVKHHERELAAQRLHLLHKNSLIGQIEEKLNELPAKLDSNSKQKLLNSIHTQEALDQDWATFTDYFSAVHSNFTQSLEKDFPTLSLTEKRLAYLLRLGTSNAEIAALLHIQADSVRKAKYRLKKKLITDEQAAESQSLEDILRAIA